MGQLEAEPTVVDAVGGFEQVVARAAAGTCRLEQRAQHHPVTPGGAKVGHLKGGQLVLGPVQEPLPNGRFCMEITWTIT